MIATHFAHHKLRKNASGSIIPKARPIEKLPATALLHAGATELCNNTAHRDASLSLLYMSTQRRALPVPKTRHHMVVHHAGGLHKGIARGWANEGKAIPLELRAHCSGFSRIGRHILHTMPAVLHWRTTRQAP